MAGTATEKSRTRAGATVPATPELADVRCSDNELPDQAIDALANFLVDQAIREVGDEQNQGEAA